MQLIPAPFIKKFFAETILYLIYGEALPLAEVYLFQEIQLFYIYPGVVTRDLLRRFVGA